ncbi:hypothetical protein HQ563_11395 [bacterium]|nr:hypothetical protein [bacterium]
MKTSVAITLIISGTVLILALFIHNAAKPEASGEFFYLVSIFAGLGMILGGAIGTFKSKAD